MAQQDKDSDRDDENTRPEWRAALRKLGAAKLDH
jgi:hypothetical protein